MTFLPSWLPFDVIRDIGWTLIHFLWQGFALAVALYVILPLCRRPAVRHNWALLISALMALAPIMTFLLVRGQEGEIAATPQGFDLVYWAQTPASFPFPWIEGIVASWLAGSAALSLRAAGGWYLARDLQRRDTTRVPSDLLQRFLGLQNHLAVTQQLEYLQSPHISAPIVVGWLRPTILIPLSAIAGLPPQQLDAIITHELAHIRRLDTVINLLLVAIETVLFYHPAVWWVTSQVRIERENCCDDLAIASCGDAVMYVEALTSFQIGKFASISALSSADGKLKQRVARLLNTPLDSRRSSVSAITGLTFLSLVSVACVATVQNSLQGGDVPFAIRVVDETANEYAGQGPPGADRVPVSLPVGLPLDAVWLKREGGMEAVVATEAHTSMGPDGRPTVAFTLAWSADAAEQFDTLTRENIGHRLAVVVDGKVVSTPTVPAEIVNIRAGGFADAVAGPDQTIVQRVTFEGTSQTEPSVVVARLSSTSTGKQHSAAVAIGDALRSRFESGLFSDLHSSFDPETSI